MTTSVVSDRDSHVHVRVLVCKIIVHVICDSLVTKHYRRPVHCADHTSCHI